jgi:hypothetical protein
VTSPVAVIGLTYRGTDLQSADLDIFFEIVRGLAEPPSVRGEDWIVPARAGRLPTNRVADVLRIELRGHVRGSGVDEDAQRADFAANRATVRALFSPTLDPGPLVATLEDGSVQNVDARTLDTIWNQVQPSFAFVSVQLESVDPDWLAGAS